MSEFSTAPVDVRDMLCAQALAVVARAVAQLAPGASLTILVGAEDVRRDLRVWANERGHAVDAQPHGLTLTRRDAR